MFTDDTEKEIWIRREKDKARQLRKTHWWSKRIDAGRCHYCGKTVGRDNLTMDHLVPMSRGGRSNKGNLVPACKECNSKKKYLLPIEWDQYINSILEKAENVI